MLSVQLPLRSLRPAALQPPPCTVLMWAKKIPEPFHLNTFLATTLSGLPGVPEVCHQNNFF